MIAQLSVAKAIVEAAEADKKSLETQLAEFEKNRITPETTIADLEIRFPDIAREIEQEIKNHEWAKDSK